MQKINLHPKKAVIVLGIFIMGLIMGTMIGTIFGINKGYFPVENEINNLTAENKKVVYIIDKKNGEPISYQIFVSEDSTVFSLLEKLAERENFNIESTIYQEMGVLVESIDGLRNGTDNKYWQYWVNEELPMVAADKEKIKGGDKVEWKFSPSFF